MSSTGVGRLSVLAVLAALLFGLAGCGGGSSTTGSSTAATDSGSAASPTGGPPKWSRKLPGHSKIAPGIVHISGGAPRRGPTGEQAGSVTKASSRAAEGRARHHAQAAHRRLAHAAGKAAPFLVPVGDNSVPTYGSEASSAQSAAAETSLSTYLAARAEGDWATACSLMSAAVAGQLEALAGEAGTARQSCAAAYAQLSERVPAARRADPLIQGLTALRVEGPHAFALFYGPGEQQYMMPMEEEGSAWRVSQLEPLPWPIGTPSPQG